MTTEIAARFDYSALPDGAGRLARSHAARVRGHLKHAGRGLVAAGELLLEVKAALPHGRWLPWLASEFNWSDRQARRLMSIAEAFGGKSDAVSELGTRELAPAVARRSPKRSS
jgi:hypothetical protein